MKLATYHDGSRDGQLVVVSRDLGSAHFASGIATRLQQVLDDWNFLAPQLQDLYATLNGGKARHAFPFEPARCLAPLPRAHRWAHLRVADSDAALTFVEAAADDLLGPAQVLEPAPSWQALALHPSLVLATGEVPAGSTPARAAEAVRLLLWAGLWRAPGQEAGEPAWATVFAPVALTPDELDGGGPSSLPGLPLQGRCGGQALPAGLVIPAAHEAFGDALAQLCAARRLRGGALVGMRPGPALQVQPGQALSLQACTADGASLFGAIEQTLGAGMPPAAD